MGVRLLYDDKENRAVLYDSVTEWAFGPVIGWVGSTHPLDAAESFLNYVDAETNTDPRKLPGAELERLYNEWSRVNDDTEQGSEDARSANGGT